tara:strand:- start:2117 stop:2353 length:237 start_codon:yes stop_codon:yes gene_type:complete
MSWLTKFVDFFTGTEKKKVRARNDKGHYVADDKSTPDVNEAYTTKRVLKNTPKKKKAVKKKIAIKKVAKKKAKKGARK